jgi:SAM-dependent methyltransferase|tara:strand:+ start:63 stop:752 length:690 start_codon:yes stop_codon:yes gene_type:complete
MIYNPFIKESIAKEWISSILDRDELGTSTHREFIEILENINEDFSEHSVIDIGCGNGFFSTFDVIKRFKKYTGIDPSETLILNAKENYSVDKVEFSTSSAYDLPFEDESFDFLISINVWFYLENILSAAKECSRILKKGSKFVIMTIDPEQQKDWFLYHGESIRFNENSVYGKWKIKTLGHHPVDLGYHYFPIWTLDEIIKSFDRSNLKIKEINKCSNKRISILGEKIG